MAGLSDHRVEKTVSFAEFKSALTTKGNAQSLRRSYHALNKLRKAKTCPAPDVRKKLIQLGQDFKASKLMSPNAEAKSC